MNKTEDVMREIYTGEISNYLPYETLQKVKKFFTV